jgi:catechol 2,3-dioxygenase
MPHAKPHTAVEASAYLHHLKILSSDPAALARFYCGAMQMSLTSQAGEEFHLAGPSRRLVIGKGVPRTLSRIAFATRDSRGLAALRERAEFEGLKPQPFKTTLIAGSCFAVTDPDGTEVVFGLATPGPHFPGLKGPLQHLALASRSIQPIVDFYHGQLGFAVSDRIETDDGRLMSCFMRSNHEHHTVTVFAQDRQGMDHHAYETGEWIGIRDWCDHFAARGISVFWGPGRHGPGNNLFSFIEDPDGNRIEISAELEVIHDRAVRVWPHSEHTVNLWGRGVLRAQ